MNTMASAAAATTTGAPDKTVIGYPALYNHVAAGTAYQCGVPPPSSYPQAYRTVGPRHSGSRPSFLCRLIAAATVLFAILGLVFLITWLVLKPRLPEFRVDSVSASPLNTTGSQLTAAWNITLVVRNPNTKLSIYYDRLQASVVYRDLSQISTMPLPPFFQPKRNETRVRFQLGVVGQYVGEDVATEISDERAGGSVGFGITVFAWMRFRTGSWWRTSQSLLRVYCDRVQIGFDPSKASGSLTSQPGSCEVDLE
ncbi:NDR1/HIN1-like protein 26 [Juglans regia]|uniref:NDR1/HIN1-like protein 26 n=2 Tax=Juglans regia TaxID=51240 RepID=A0A2I4GQG4_JUGRE|nr:NDR1/HIN1-like protein 26 [Juglans regia]